MEKISINIIKKELQELSQKQLVDICIQLAKARKENKEQLDFLLLKSHHISQYELELKAEIDAQFEMFTHYKYYQLIKPLKAYVKSVLKQISYSKNPSFELEIIIYLCKQFFRFSDDESIWFYKINIIYDSLARKIEPRFKKLHEDEQFDYRVKLEEINYF